ncbi:MAG: carboxypeptidase regulatory-like domain-containing protein [Bacteroidota bacterium]
MSIVIRFDEIFPLHLYLLRTLLLSFGIGIAVSANAQQLVIKGAVIDTINHQPLDQAVISLLRSKDSVLVQFVRTNPKGQVQLKGVVPAKYIILISYPNYADYVDQIQVATDQVNDLGNIPLLTKVQLLEEVIVKQKIAAIRLRGDTTEYRADSFRVSANANVQELLRKRP